MHSDVRARLTARWQTKALITVVLPLYFGVFYFGIQNVPLQAHALTPTAVDRAIAFEPRWTAVYQSLYLLLPIPWFCTSAADLRRYTSGFLTMTAVAFAMFLVFPVEGPRPMDLPDHAPYRALLTYDQNRNALPSLHAALTAYTALMGIRLFRSRAARALLLLWTALIIYSTMAIKQHWAVDVILGVLLALAADLFARNRIRIERKNAYEPSPPWIDPSSSPGGRPAGHG